MAHTLLHAVAVFGEIFAIAFVCALIFCVAPSIVFRLYKWRRAGVYVKLSDHGLVVECGKACPEKVAFQTQTSLKRIATGECADLMSSEVSDQGRAGGHPGTDDMPNVAIDTPQEDLEVGTATRSAGVEFIEPDAEISIPLGETAQHLAESVCQAGADQPALREAAFVDLPVPLAPSAVDRGSTPESSPPPLRLSPIGDSHTFVGLMLQKLSPRPPSNNNSSVDAETGAFRDPQLLEQELAFTQGLIHGALAKPQDIAIQEMALDGIMALMRYEKSDPGHIPRNLSKVFLDFIVATMRKHPPNRSLQQYCCEAVTLAVACGFEDRPEMAELVQKANENHPSDEAIQTLTRRASSALLRTAAADGCESDDSASNSRFSRPSSRPSIESC